MSKKKWVVRVVIPTVDNHPPLAQRIDGAFLECLSYAGFVTLHHDDEERQTFDLHAPFNLNGKVWAEQNAARMTTFGYNAVAAPAAPATN